MESAEVLLAKKLYNLKLGEKMDYPSGGVIVRVPGGWVLGDDCSGSDYAAMTSCFIPYNNEFQFAYFHDKE